MRSLFAVLLVVSGCAIGDGEPFGLVSASLDAHYVDRDDRDAGQGYQKLVSGYEVRLDAFTVTVDTIELLAAEDQAEAFDPANPPPGYSLCHGGHCHADDGRLVAYEDVAAELAGGEGASVVLRFAGVEPDLVEAAPIALTCDPSCVLERGHLSLLRLTATSLEISGTVRDGLPEPRIAGEIPLSATLSLLPAEGAPASPLAVAIDVPLDEEHEPAITLRIALYPTAALFDEVDFASIPPDPDGVLVVHDDPAATASIKGAWADVPLTPHIARPE